MRYKIISYKLQDGRWGSAFVCHQPISNNSDYATLSERTELGVYFQTEAEADEYTHSHLIKSGAAADDILRKYDENINNNRNYPL